MAERAAHVTSTLQSKPSIFEVIASDSLHSTFPPAIKRLCNSLATINPETFGWTIQFYDEFYLLINAAIQQYYIRIYGGSLSEVFYGLTRTTWHSDVLSHKSKIIIFISIVILPYIQMKLNNLIQKWKRQIEDTPGTTEHIKTKTNIINVYNTAVTIYECLQIFQYIAYMSNSSKSHSNLLRILQMNLSYLPPDENMDWTWTDLFMGKIKYSTMLSTVVFRGLELSAFFLQFIQWWQNEASQGSITNLPVPEPPQYDVNSEKYTGKCPICLQPWQIPTAISISGYVYCYKCIINHFNNSKTCPVTNYPASIEDLLRIYED